MLKIKNSCIFWKFAIKIFNAVKKSKFHFTLFHKSEKMGRKIYNIKKQSYLEITWKKVTIQQHII